MRAALWFAVAAIILAGSSGASAQDEKNAPGMEEAMKMAMPGPVHQGLARMAGEYTTARKIWMQPGGQPMESKGTAQLKTILGGRFLHEDATSSMMGIPVQEMRLTGYNNATKRYEGLWAYTMATGMMTLNGSSKDDGKTIDWEASFTDARGKQTMQAVTRFVDDDHFVIELIAKMPDGSPGPHFETTYTRKK
jgi:hypothetical protein